MRSILIIISIVSFWNCGKKSNELIGDFTRSVKSVDELNLYVKSDSIGNQIFDTISLVNKNFGVGNRIKNRKEDYYYGDEIMEIDYEYNWSNEIKREIVKMTSDTIVMNYNYEKSLLKSVVGNSVSDEFSFSQLTTFQYNENDILISDSTFQLSIDMATNDTISKSITVKKYGKNRIVLEEKISYEIHPERNKYWVYGYEDGRISKTILYNNQDSVISNFSYEYINDNFGNWIQKRTLKVDTLKYLYTRKIEY